MSGVAETFRYKAFLSYSHQLDGEIATALQRGLQAFARPLLRRRSMRIFRDSSDLGASPHLWDSVQHALEASEYLILCASPESASSLWVEREVTWWVRKRGTASVLVVLTAGDLRATERPGRGYRVAGDSALPPALRDALEGEPRLVDLRWARGSPSLSLRHSVFRAALLDLAAPLLGRDKAELDSEEVRSFRRRRALLALGVTALAVSTLFAGAQWLAARQRLTAIRVELARQAILRGEPAAAEDFLDFETTGDAELEGRIVSFAGEAPRLLLSESLEARQDAGFDAAGRRFYLGSDRGEEWVEKGFDLSRSGRELSELEAEAAFDPEERLGRRLHARGVGGESWLTDPASGERWRAAVGSGEIWYRDPRSQLAAAAGSASVRLFDLRPGEDGRASELCAVPRRASGFGDGDDGDLEWEGDKPWVGFSPDGDVFAVGGFPVQLWGISSCRPIASLPLVASYPEGVWFSPSGRHFATRGGLHLGSGSYSVTVWRLPRSHILLRLGQSRDGRWMATDSELQLTRDDGLWRWDAGALLLSKPARPRPVGPRGTVFEVSRDGEHALRRTPDGKVEVLAGPDSKVRCTLPPSGREGDFRLSPRGRFVVESGESYQPWSILSGENCRVLYSLDPRVPRARGPIFGGSDQDLAALGETMTNGTGATVRLVDAWRLGERSALKLKRNAELMNEEDLLCRLCSTHSDERGLVVDPTPDGAASLIRDVFAPPEAAADHRLEGVVHGVAFSSGGKLVLGWKGRAVGVWSLATQRQLVALEGHRADVIDGAITADGRLAVTWDFDGESIVWRLW
jgi:WD40 repeat protein